jgi:hypothetical protein
MDKKPLGVISICVVMLFILGSLSNVMGTQSIKSTVNNSPLFIVRTNRATSDENYKVITSDYLGKGIKTLSFPLQETSTGMIQKFIDNIRTMDDDTFNRFIDYVIFRINYNNNLKNVEVNDFIKGLRQIRKNIQNIVIDKDLKDNMITYSNYQATICWLPGCIFTYFFAAIIIIIEMIYIFYINGPSMVAPPCLLQSQ